MATRTRRAPAPTIYPGGPYVGNRDLSDPTARAKDRAYRMTNVYVRDPQRRTAVVGRPGYTTTDDGTPAAGAVQALGEFNRLGGARYRFRVADGAFETYDFGTDTWTPVALGGGCALSSAADTVAWVVVANQLVLSDGTNTPCAWDGTTWTALTNCPVLLYQPWVHAGRLFGIKASDGGATIVWCEPNQLNVGYEATIGLITYRNAWTLGQTSQDAIVAGAGMNDRLLLWRRQSTTSVFGLIDENFQTGASRETVSETIGCGAPYAVRVVDGTPYWIASDGWLYCLPPGATDPIGIGDEIAETMATVNVSALARSTMVFDRATDLLYVALPIAGQTVPDTVFPVHTVNRAPQGRWTGWGTIAAMAAVHDASGNLVVLHGGTDGVVYRHGHPTGALWHDEPAGVAPTAIYHQLRTEALGWDAATEQFWDRCDLSLRAPTRLTNLVVQAYGPYGYGPAQVSDATSSNARWDESQWDDAQWALEGLDQHATFTFELHGRWQQFEVRHNTINERFGFLMLNAWATPVAAYPGAP